uniref:Thioredoxin domain-containing protein n=1 Tax=Steinernema glaseri TaxID=37863 RepID=A0A1I7ZKN7_9BILA
MRLISLVLVLAVLAVNAEKKEKNPHAHGFGDDIEWVKWDNAISTAMDVHKPIFLLVHKTWCGACKSLKNAFRVSTNRGDLVKLSEKFIMTNTEDDEEPEDEEYAPDGGYIPRIFFLDEFGKRLPVDNKKAYPNNHYYYPQVADIIKGMEKALKLVEGEGKKETESKKEEEAKEVKKADQKEESEEKKEEEKTGGCPHAAKAKAKKEKEQKAKKEKKDSAKEEKKSKKEKKEKKDDASDEESKEAKKEKKSDDKEKKSSKKSGEGKKKEEKKEKAKSDKSKSKDGEKKEKKEKSKKNAKTEL